MANLPRTAKSADDWASRDLTAYNITISYQSPEIFFGSHPATLPAGLDPAFVTTLLPPLDDPALTDDTTRLLHYLAFATQRTIASDPNKASAIRDFAREILPLLMFTAPRAVLRSRYALPFTVCNDSMRSAQLDFCLLRGANPSTVLLVVQVRETAVPTVGFGEPATRVVPHAIAAFQSNNAARAQAGLGALDAMTIPVIQLLGTRPIFYRVPVTQALSEAVERGEYPAEGTEVAMCVAVPAPPTLEEGMEGPEFRREALCHFEAFREMAKGCWEGFLV